MDNQKTECGNLQKSEDKLNSIEPNKSSKANQFKENDAEDADPIIEDVMEGNSQKLTQDDQILSESQKMVEDEMQFAPTSLSYENMDDIKKDMEEK